MTNDSSPETTLAMFRARQNKRTLLFIGALHRTATGCYYKCKYLCHMRQRGSSLSRCLSLPSASHAAICALAVLEVRFGDSAERKQACKLLLSSEIQIFVKTSAIGQSKTHRRCVCFRNDNAPSLPLLSSYLEQYPMQY